MNYYERHLGDYARDTGHLTPLEHGVYNLLLDRYYATELPIPDGQANRICRARSKEERNAVKAVLEEFFFLKDGEWHNERCDAEIKKFQESEPEREARRENNRERVRRHRERRAALFSELREAGIVPPYDTATAELESMVKRVKKQPVTPPVTHYDTANQSPDTSNQIRAKAKAAAVPPDDFKADLFRRWKELPNGGGGAFLNKLFRDHKPEQRVLEAVEHTLDETRNDPKAYVVAALSARAKAESAHEDLMARAI